MFNVVFVSKIIYFLYYLMNFILIVAHSSKLAKQKTSHLRAPDGRVVKKVQLAAMWNDMVLFANTACTQPGSNVDIIVTSGACA